MPRPIEEARTEQEQERTVVYIEARSGRCAIRAMDSGSRDKMDGWGQRQRASPL